ncbi:MAG: hypothetical protein KGJ13_09765, partial [Patescibacteria group bacterium]|nr:hypothetical protein [Patescibacteria group bacterium]
EEINSLTPKAKKRFHALSEKVKELAQKPQPAAEESPEAPENKTEPKPEKKEFQNIKEFLDAVEDEPSRELLSHLYNVIKKETSSILGPVEQRNNEARFEAEFSAYAAKFPNLADHKNDLRKTFLRNPETPIKSLIGDTLVDLQMAKVEIQGEGESKASREGKPDLDSMSKEDLYGELENQLGSLHQ